MHLHINARFLTQPLSGAQRFAEELLRVVDECAPQALPGVRLIAWSPSEVRRTPEWRNIEWRTCGRTSGHLWEQTELPRAARGGLLLNLVSSAPILHPRQVVTLLDAAVFDRPENFSRQYRLFHRTLRPLLARRALRILTCSEFSSKSLSRATGVEEERFLVLYPSAGHLQRIAADDGILARNGLSAGSFILFVGNEAPHKNVATAYEAFARLNRADLQFVAVGMGRPEVFGQVEQAGARPIKRLKGVGDAELRALYEAAALLVFPSRYEGFGIPVLEAMTFGCPVVSSNAGGLCEAAGDAALLVAPDDVSGMSEAVRRVLDDGELRRSLIANGRRQAARFIWEKAGRKLLESIAELVSARP